MSKPKKGYIALEGGYYTSWEFISNKVFKTKKLLHEHMVKQECHGFTKNMEEIDFHEKWQSDRYQYGYIIEPVEIYE